MATNILEIKPLIRDFIADNLDESFGNKVYWNGERYEVPETPYCFLSVIAESKDKRTSTHNGEVNDDTVEVITTIYKTATITVAIYNDAIGGKYRPTKEFAYEQISHLEQLFEMRSTHERFYPKFSIQNVSPIRPLHEVADGGYEFRFEFDLTIGFNEVITDTNGLVIGEAVQTTINNTDDNNELINFEVTVTDTVNVKI